MEHTRSAPPRPWRSLARAKAANLAMLVAALATALHLSASATQPLSPAYDLELAAALATASPRGLQSADDSHSYSYSYSYFFVVETSAPTALPVPAPTTVPVPAPTALPAPAPTALPVPAPSSLPVPLPTTPAPMAAMLAPTPVPVPAPTIVTCTNAFVDGNETDMDVRGSRALRRL